MYYWCHGDNYITKQLSRFIFNINLNDIHMKMKGFANLQEREGKDSWLSDVCEQRGPAVYTLKVTDHGTHQSPAPGMLEALPRSPSASFSFCLFSSIFFSWFSSCLSLTFCPQTW